MPDPLLHDPFLLLKFSVLTALIHAGMPLAARPKGSRPGLLRTLTNLLVGAAVGAVGWAVMLHPGLQLALLLATPPALFLLWLRIRRDLAADDRQPPADDQP
ncbi:hypothetical protein ACFQ0M_49110 [Kitasatospora aburaviensis]|uniref:Uncharacterized protein n=1 Tax=Kitasatospora aburaviensis TaxID=67265 RepID=A0ABW1F934_9ACTN